jgi:hypothetical protein
MPMRTASLTLQFYWTPSKVREALRDYGVRRMVLARYWSFVFFPTKNALGLGPKAHRHVGCFRSLYFE